MNCKSCGGNKFHKVGKVKIVEHGDFGNKGTWETTFTELIWDEYEFSTYICGNCGRFFDDNPGVNKAPLFWHPV